MKAVASQDIQTTTTTAPAPTVAKTPGTGQQPPGVLVLEHYIKGHSGAPDPGSVSDIVEKFPADRNAMFTLLHGSIGNAFVQRVIVSMKASGDKAAADPVPDAPNKVRRKKGAGVPTPTPRPAQASDVVAAPTPAPTHTPAPEPIATISAAPTTTATKPEEKPGFFHRMGHDAKVGAQGAWDAAELLLELEALGLTGMFTGVAQGYLDIGKAAHYAQLIVGGNFAKVITLESAGRGSASVYVKFNLWHRTAELSAKEIKIAGVHTATFSAGECDLKDLHATGAASGTASVTFSRADFHDPVFVRGKEHVSAKELIVTGMSISGVDATSVIGMMHFADAQVHGLAYPNMPPIDFELGGGTSFEAVWQRSQPAAPTVGAKTTTTTPPAGHGTGVSPATQTAPTDGLPSVPALLPAGATIEITFDGLHAEAIGGAGGGGGDAGFKRLYAAMKKADKTLASVEIDGFNAAGATTGGGVGGGASIQTLVITGDPSLVQTLLSNPQLAHRASVKDAIALVTSVGLTPSASGTITAHNITASSVPGVVAGRGDFAGHFDLPSLGVFDIKIDGLVAQQQDVTKGLELNSAFNKLTMSLHDHQNQAIAALELDNASVGVDGAKKKGHIGHLTAHGNVAQLVKAGSDIVDHMPTAVRGAMQAIRELGVTGEISGSLDMTTIKRAGKPELEFTGDFDAQLDAGSSGSVVLKLSAFKGGDQGDISFSKFSAQLRDHAGKQAASLAISGGSSPGNAPAGTTRFHANQIDAHGDDASLAALLGTLDTKASSLPEAVKSAFLFIRRFYAQAGGSLTLNNVTAGTDKAGNEVGTAHDVQANFEVDGAAKANISMTGFRTVLGKHENQLDFATFDAKLADAKGKPVAHVVIEGSHDSFAATGNDFGIKAKKLLIDGDTHEVAHLFAGVRKHIAELPPPIATAFHMIEHYGSEIKADGTVEADDIALTSHAGKVIGTGDISTHLHVPQGELVASVTGARSDGDHVSFDALAVELKDAKGTLAASLHALGGHGNVKGDAAGLTNIQVFGDATKLQSLLDPSVQKSMPPALAGVLAMLKGSDLNAGATNLEMTATPGGGYTATAGRLNASGTLHITDNAGNVYTAKGAQIELDGAQLTLGADKKPREVSATSLFIHGQFSSDGGGTVLQGDATVRTGAAHITLDAAGNPTMVNVANVFASGEGSRTTGVATAKAGAVAPVTTPTAASGVGTSAHTAAPRPNADALASHDHTTAVAEDVASAITNADIHTSTPLVPGLYGRGMLHASIPANATINLNVQVRQHKLTSATNLRIMPVLNDPAWLTSKGADLETKGTEGIVRLRVGGLFHLLDLNLNKYIVGKGKPLSLNVNALIQEIMDYVRSGMPAAEPEQAAGTTSADGSTTATAPSGGQAQGGSSHPAAPTKAELKAEKEARDNEEWLEKKHASWQKDVAKHERQDANKSAADREKRENKDIGAEPRSASFTDMFTKAIEYSKTSASADLTLAKADKEATVLGDLHGHTDGGGRVELQSNEMHAALGNNSVTVTGADTGDVDISKPSENTTHVSLAGLKIDSLQWSPNTVK